MAPAKVEGVLDERVQGAIQSAARRKWTEGQPSILVCMYKYRTGITSLVLLNGFHVFRFHVEP